MLCATQSYRCHRDTILSPQRWEFPSMGGPELSLPRAQVQSLVWELRSCKPLGVAKKQKAKELLIKRRCHEGRKGLRCQTDMSLSSGIWWILNLCPWSSNLTSPLTDLLQDQGEGTCCWVGEWSTCDNLEILVG